MRCTVRGLRSTCSPCSRSAVRVYCSIASVSLPSRTTNCPVWAASAAGSAIESVASPALAGMAVSVRSRHANRGHFVVLRDLVHHVLPLTHLSENGVDSIEVRLRRVTDEKLAAPRVLSGMRHGERPRHVFVDVFLRLALDRVARPAGADASLPGLGVGIAALDHEVGDHAMKSGSIVEARVGELFEVGDRARHFVGEQLHLDATLAGLEYGLLVRHQISTERFSFTCATVFMPIITTDTASLSSTNRRASCAAVTLASPASSATRAPSAASCST